MVDTKKNLTASSINLFVWRFPSTEESSLKYFLQHEADENEKLERKALKTLLKASYSFHHFIPFLVITDVDNIQKLSKI